MNEFVEQFLLESRELLDQATADLLAVEENPGNVERLDGAFRAFHTLKGSAGIVDFAGMARAAHAAEDVLAEVRSGKASVSRELISNCLSCLDLILQWLDAMQIDGEIPSAADAQATAMERRLTEKAAPRYDASVPLEAPPLADAAGKRFSAPAKALLQAQLLLLQETAADGLIGRLLSAGRVTVNVLRSGGFAGEIANIERATGVAAAAEQAGPLAAAIEALLPVTPEQSPSREAIVVADTVTARVLRVDVKRIDALVKLTGELIVAKNAVGHVTQLARANTDPQILADLLKDQHALLNRLIEELQQSVLTIRVLPLRHVFNRFPKLVREISETLGRPAKLVTEGDDTEADKVVVENLFEPLLHIIRNALDHGVEAGAERAALGKAPTATITLRASRSGDAVLVVIEDDGRGIDLEKVRVQAVKRQIVAPDAAAEMTAEEIADLVFAPGFSTAASVTDLSGRGVGMDVVRRNVGQMGGTARITSQPGLGTRVTLRLPFSVMMTRIMTVEAGGQVFGLPLESVLETIRLPRHRIFPIGKGQAFVLRDRTVPLIELAKYLGRGRAALVHPEASIVVFSVGGKVGGVEVDLFGDRLDVMLKPMDGLLQGVSGVAGTCLMGDGNVLIVLDLYDLLQ